MSVAARYARELAKMYDEQAAEIATLKGEVERLQRYNQECHRDLEAANKENVEMVSKLNALVTAGKASNFQTPDTVGEYRYVLVSDSTDLSEDDGYCYSRDLEGIMNRPEAERQLSSRRPEERPELYALVPLKQFDALSAAVREAKGEVGA